MDLAYASQSQIQSPTSSAASAKASPTYSNPSSSRGRRYGSRLRITITDPIAYVIRRIRQGFSDVLQPLIFQGTALWISPTHHNHRSNRLRHPPHPPRLLRRTPTPHLPGDGVMDLAYASQSQIQSPTSSAASAKASP